MKILSHRQMLAGLLVTALPVMAPSTASMAQALSSSKAVTASEAEAKKQAAAKARSKKILASRSAQAILVLVNDQPITRFDMQQRASFLAVQTNLSKQAQSKFKQLASSAQTQRKIRQLQQRIIRNNKGKSRDEIIAIFRKRQRAFGANLQSQALRSVRSGLVKRKRRKALDELIDERLQLQAAKKLNSIIADSQVDDFIKRLAARNKLTPTQFAAQLKRNGSNISTMKARMKARFSWRRLVTRRFSSQVSVSQAQIDNVVAASAASAGQATVELQLQRITLVLPANNSQSILAQRFAEAERVRERFKGCESMAGLVKGLANAKFEKLGNRKPDTFPEPARTMLLSAKNGQMTPPMLETNGVEFFAVCGRRALKGDEKARSTAKASLREKEFEVLARRHLRDLRTDALICRRQEASYLNHLAPCQRF